MKTPRHPAVAVGGWILPLVLSLNSYSDDIEVYTGSSNSVRANVLFIMDTSGNMSANADDLISNIDIFDPNVTYPTLLEGFNANSLYLYPFDVPITDLSSAEQLLLRSLEITYEQFLCPSALDELRNTGFYGGSLKMWDGISWSGSDIVGVDTPNILTAVCEANSGPFTDLLGIEYTYLKKGSTGFPFTNLKSERVNWNTDKIAAIYSGNFLNYSLGVADTLTDLSDRLAVTQEAAINVVKSVNGVNLSLMTYSADSEGGFVDIAMSPIETIADAFESKILSYETGNNNPLEETLFEAFRYLSGDSVLYGDQSKSGTRITESTPESRQENNYNQYQAPDALSCTPTKVIMFSAGQPTNDRSANSLIQSLIESVPLDEGLDKSCEGDGACLEEFADYISRTDHRADIEGIQNITVDTLGGFLDGGSEARHVLERIAESNGGVFYPVNNYAEIFNALSHSLLATITTPSTFTAPTVAVNSFNSLENSDQLYFSVFEPNNRPAWKGNLKRYRIDGDGIIRDLTGAAAVDETSGFFTDSSISYWAEKDDTGNLIVDGANVGLGGAAGRLSIARNLFTTVSGQITKLQIGEIPNQLNSQTLSQVIPSALTDVLTAEKLGIPEATLEYQQQLIRWMMGLTSTYNARKEIEDPLHSQPLVINYGQGDATIFIATNSGFLHAFNPDSESGEEYFSFIPEELLKAPYAFFERSVLSEDLKRYGLDGPLSYYHEDENLDGIVNGSDRVYLYVGMRRGGHSYYALDVTNRREPKLIWQLNGLYTQPDKVNVPDLSPGFERLGQTWSSLVPSEIKWNGQPRIVLFTGGGYDPVEDGTSMDGLETQINHTVGNTLYMIDAITGELLWDAHAHLPDNTDMKHSFATDVIPIDKDDNGFVDLLYAADIGGKVWRFDISEQSVGRTDFAKGGVIANVNDGTASGNRRFFSTPDISFFDQLVPNFTLISIGSGYRAHPLTTSVEDYHFLIKDNIGKGQPSEYVPTEFNDLVRWGSPNEINNESSSAGWYIPLTATGEKVLNRSATLKGNVVFSTYAPNTSSGEIFCGGDTGTARLYLINIYQPDAAESVIELSQGGIPPSPTFVMPPEKITDVPLDENGEPVELKECEQNKSVILVGPEIIEANINRCDQVSRDYWREI